MTKLQILRETIKYFSRHDRAIISKEGTDVCVYKHAGRKCAVGRCLDYRVIGDARLRHINSGKDVYHLDALYDLDRCMKSDYKGHSVDFWADLQNFHDHCGFWDGKRLTARGKAFRNTLIKKYSK